MKERPILFSAPMVRALLDGTKMQTRRPVKFPRTRDAFVMIDHGDGWWPYQSDDGESELCNDGNEHPYNCPYGQPGDGLRVKEAAWMWCERRPAGKTKTGRDKWLYVPLHSAPVIYAADHPQRPAIDVVSPDTGNQWGWRLKIGRFLPAWASRITLEVTGVRVERLQDISNQDCKAEGVLCETADPLFFHVPEPGNVYANADEMPKGSYRKLWESINGVGSWAANPWVWVVTFQRVAS